MKKLWMVATIFLISITLMGCGTREATNDTVNDNTGNDTTNENVETESNMGGEESLLELADEAADKVVELDEVDSATVIITNNNAYVGAVLENETEDMDQIQEKIKEQVEATNANVNNVYVSVNPDFVERMTDYGNKIDEGKPVAGLFEEFNETVQRIFPEAS
ncbi:YhcN/YlaJ family sporulation lipoprotein [Paenisporosarcina antarctica]|uniref:YhcN/YlaJ family sporulation lipoprotein n=1 Tax=Paenisporosarcina antarctica TaxID=417367 RepID=A0A4P6ZV79_9BACL|nr:YhcN/YlaJ family sporulation lipoprotein [Paenisporosarcina antarctica]QBP40312.1 YhcN/YlaJ family sporulation lipoprotein [Paenisporosarcina antarctica]